METYSTSDINLSACLLSLGYPFTGIERIGGGKVEFHFALDEKADSVVREYWQRNLKTEPVTFGLNLRMLKNLVHQRPP